MTDDAVTRKPDFVLLQLKLLLAATSAAVDQRPGGISFKWCVLVFRKLVNTVDLTKPHLWYTAARSLPRRIIYHAGPTNSGKTYNALQVLSLPASACPSGGAGCDISQHHCSQDPATQPCRCGPSCVTHLP